jgi:hypothetical protein
MLLVHQALFSEKFELTPSRRGALILKLASWLVVGMRLGRLLYTGPLQHPVIRDTVRTWGLCFR